MSTLKKIAKWTLLTVVSLIIILVAFGFWFMSLIPKQADGNELSSTTSQSLPYLTQNLPPNRGKILAVVTSTDLMGSSG